MNVIEALNWRYAVRQFSDERLDEDRVKTLLNATQLSATSYGLQPYRILLVNDLEVRRALLKYAMGQEKVVDCSHLVVFAACADIGDDMVDQYIQSVSQTRDIPVTDLDGISGHMKEVFSGMDDRQKKEWAHQQAYIALGTMLTAAAMMKIDSCPMGGFDSRGFDQVLGLSQHGLEAVVICALGIRHPDDQNAHLPKVRYGVSEMVIDI